MIKSLIVLPLQGLIVLGERIKKELDRELYDITFLQQELKQLHMMYELGEISEEYYVSREEELLHHLQVAQVRKWQEFETVGD